MERKLVDLVDQLSSTEDVHPPFNWLIELLILVSVGVQNLNRDLRH